MKTKTNSIFSYVKSYLEQNGYININSKCEFDFDKKIFVNFNKNKKVKFLIKNFNKFSKLNQDSDFLLDNKINYILFLKDYFEIFIYKINVYEEII